MKFSLVSTTNVQRLWDAAETIEGRLADHEIMGLGLAYGRPGLGKTMTIQAYHARARKVGRIRTVCVRALSIWSETSMLKWLLLKMGQSPRAYRKDVLFDQVIESLESEPALILMDEIDAIAESRRLMMLVKEIHDMTGSAILMIGEERVDGLLRRHESLYNRINHSALVHLTGHTAADVQSVIAERCDVAVDPAVCDEIHATIGKVSMRSVIDRIRDIEEFAMTNEVEQFSLSDYRQMLGRPETRQAVAVAERLAIAGGDHA